MPTLGECTENPPVYNAAMSPTTANKPAPAAAPARTPALVVWLGNGAALAVPEAELPPADPEVAAPVEVLPALVAVLVMPEEAVPLPATPLMVPLEP